AIHSTPIEVQVYNPSHIFILTKKNPSIDIALIEDVRSDVYSYYFNHLIFQHLVSFAISSTSTSYEFKQNQIDSQSWDDIDNDLTFEPSGNYSNDSSI